MNFAFKRFQRKVTKSTVTLIQGFLGGSESKESACNTGDLGSIPGLGRLPGGGHGNPSNILA